MPNKRLTLSNQLQGLRFEIVSPSHRKHPEGDIILPKRSTKNAAAYDIYSPVDATISPGGSVMVWTDVKAIMPHGIRLDLNVRSSMGKYRISLANTIGWVDPDYANCPENDGNLGICLVNGGNQPYVIKVGDRIAQGSFSVFFITEDDGDNEAPERVGGFGSTNQ